MKRMTMASSNNKLGVPVADVMHASLGSIANHLWSSKKPSGYFRSHGRLKILGYVIFLFIFRNGIFLYYLPKFVSSGQRSFVAWLQILF